MRRMYWLVFLFSICCLILNGETVSAGSNPNTVNLISSSGEETILEFVVGSFDIHSVSIEGKEWQILCLPKEGTLLREGYPQLPVVNRSLAIPSQGLMKLELLESEYVEYPYKVAPSKGNLTRDIDP
ncbi:MAG: C25 family peptidase propeptide domain-containing protein, partial [Candidatus Cloacimonadaceae bacterium]|nr:C25 family peptidase propeptide domain-containing protein [Candidatus Cloacimonadaceae bacterium]